MLYNYFSGEFPPHLCYIYTFNKKEGIWISTAIINPVRGKC